jgi:hypothetical protein
MRAGWGNMSRMKTSKMFIWWIIVLVIELIVFKQEVFGGPVTDESIYYFTMIFATLVVGAIGSILTSINRR